MNNRRPILIVLAILVIVLFAYLLNMSRNLPAIEQDGGHDCTITIRCDDLIDKLDLLEQGKRYLVPATGILLSAEHIAFTEGETVFDLTKRAAIAADLHIDFQDPTGYSSAYIRGIGNLYEFDAGELSGWALVVNGEYPSVGCSDITLQDGDVIEWLYVTDYFGTTP